MNEDDRRLIKRFRFRGPNAIPKKQNRALYVLGEIGGLIFLVVLLLPYAFFWLAYSFTHRESPFKEWDAQK